ncbi:hypothetical protein HanIR_Chr03g0131661 [Helianthus annuus]|nr:hypothetical protein HanIR_Chr03g0131661 [Helianthus annuus]
MTGTFHATGPCRAKGPYRSESPVVPNSIPAYKYQLTSSFLNFHNSEILSRILISHT